MVNRPDDVASAGAAAADDVVDHPDMMVSFEIDWIQMNYFRRNYYWLLHLNVVAVVVELMMSMMRYQDRYLHLFVQPLHLMQAVHVLVDCDCDLPNS